jgi:hypothetical protein
MALTLTPPVHPANPAELVSAEPEVEVAKLQTRLTLWQGSKHKGLSAAVVAAAVVVFRRAAIHLEELFTPQAVVVAGDVEVVWGIRVVRVIPVRQQTLRPIIA